MAIPPRNRLLILNIAIFSERRDFKEFIKILSRRPASLYLTINKFFQKIEKEKMTRPYHFKKFDFPKGIPLQKSNFLKR